MSCVVERLLKRSNVWWAGSERITVYISTSTTCVVSKDANGMQACQWIEAESPIAGFELAMGVIKDRRASRGKSSLDVQLSGSLARPFMFEAVAGLKRWREALDVAA